MGRYLDCCYYVAVSGRPRRSIRGYVLNGAEEMERALRPHDGTRGDEWMFMGIHTLANRLQQEQHELWAELCKFWSMGKDQPLERVLAETICKECVDVMNVANFIRARFDTWTIPHVEGQASNSPNGRPVPNEQEEQ